MINLRITGLYNRGQQDEYVELEAAARCDRFCTTESNRCSRRRASLFLEWRLRRSPQAHAEKGRDRNRQAFEEGEEKQEE